MLRKITEWSLNKLMISTKILQHNIVLLIRLIELKEDALKFSFKLDLVIMKIVREKDNRRRTTIKSSTAD